MSKPATIEAFVEAVDELNVDLFPTTIIRPIYPGDDCRCDPPPRAVPPTTFVETASQVGVLEVDGRRVQMLIIRVWVNGLMRILMWSDLQKLLSFDALL